MTAFLAEGDMRADQAEVVGPKYDVLTRAAVTIGLKFAYADDGFEASLSQRAFGLFGGAAKRLKLSRH